ncbi:MAG TPA: cation diffusion facilitator family transporter [Caulifigura sp.]|jgi:cation diffusion facilitator family transporter|nr:cation diffusion facilitator family transporter [Caulifigura sp.]
MDSTPSAADQRVESVPAGGHRTVPASPDSLYQQVWRAAWLGLVVNLTLGLAKLIGGIVGDSFALISDSVNSLGDVVATVVVLIAVRIAQQPADDEHPYGHTRAEAIAASTVAVLIMVSALGIGWEAIQRLTLIHSLPEAWTLWIAGINVVIKEWLYRYKVRVGKRTGSQAMIANAWDHRSDALCALAVLIGLATVRWGDGRWMWADEVAALVVVGAILFTSLRLYRDSASELMDLQADNTMVDQVRTMASSIPGVRGVEKLWVRKSGLEYFVDIHLEVDPDLTVAEGHRIGHVVKDRLTGCFASIRDVLVHLEPFSDDHGS